MNGATVKSFAGIAGIAKIAGDGRDCRVSRDYKNSRVLGTQLLLFNIDCNGTKINCHGGFVARESAYCRNPHSASW